MAYPVLAAQNTWWKPNVSSVTRASITEIEIMDSYTPDSSVTVVDSWDASAAQDWSITCYVIGTKLIMAGNGSGKIAANEDSSYCFVPKDFEDNFVALHTFSGTNMLDTSNVTNMLHMFTFCMSLTTIDVSTWDVSKVTNMEALFAICTALTSINGLNNWNVVSVTNMNNTFGNCSKLISVDLSNWDVSNVTDMQGMFYKDKNLTATGDLSNWNVASVTTMMKMFDECGSLASVGNLTNWDVSSVTDLYCMFQNCSSLTSVGNIASWDVSNVTMMNGLFNGCLKLTSTGDLTNWNVVNVEGMQNLFANCSKLTGIGDLANWNPSSCINMSFMFYGCSSIGEIDVSKWNTSKLTNLDHFAAHAGLRRIGMENWNTSSLTNANAAFHNCAEEELDLSGWDVSNVQFFNQMFENSPNLKRIKGLENWNTSAGLGFDGMFERCYVLEELDLSSFDTSKAKNGVTASNNGHKTATLQNMFLSCNNLRKITLGSNFAVNGDGTNTTAANKLILPTPSTEYLEGADGSWYDFGGMEYAPNAIPDRTANTYYAVYDDVGDADMIIKNDTLIQIAKAIRTKNGGTDRYQPSEFAAAIEALS